MSTVKKVYTTAVSPWIKEIKYKSVDSDEGELELQIVTDDLISLVEVTRDYFILQFTKTVQFIPEALYDLQITVLMKFDLDIEKTWESFSDLDELKLYLEDMQRMRKFANASEVGATISLLIAEISSVFGRRPIVLPPFFNVED